MSHAHFYHPGRLDSVSLQVVHHGDDRSILEDHRIQLGMSINITPDNQLNRTQL